MNFLLVGEVRTPLRSTQDGPHAPEQLSDRERLGHVVVRPRVESLNAAALLAFRAEHQDRRRQALAANLPTHLIAAHSRKQQVEDDEIGLALLHQPVAILAV